MSVKNWSWVVAWTLLAGAALAAAPDSIPASAGDAAVDELRRRTGDLETKMRDQASELERLRSELARRDTAFKEHVHEFELRGELMEFAQIQKACPRCLIRVIDYDHGNGGATEKVKTSPPR